MLSAKNRLSLSRTRLNLVQGQRVEGKELRVIGKRESGIFKVAIIISKKVAPKAVDRNRIKRLVSEAVRTNLDKIKFEGNLIIIAKENIARYKKSDIQDKILMLIDKL